MENEDDSLVLTPKWVGQRLKISRSVLYNSLKNGTIPCIKISPRKILIPKSAFFRWLDDGGGNNPHPNIGHFLGLPSSPSPRASGSIYQLRRYRRFNYNCSQTH